MRRVKKKRGRGQKGKYTLSPAALAQRRSAAWKHGRDATTALRQVVPPCSAKHCPMAAEDELHNCSLRRQVVAQGGDLEVCPVHLTLNRDVRERYLAAIRDGKLDGLAELSATALAGMTQLAQRELGQLQTEGLAIPFATFGPEGEAADGVKVNPRAAPTLQLLEMLGHTAAQQAITPKSQGERRRDEGLTGLAELLVRRRQLADVPVAAVEAEER